MRENDEITGLFRSRLAGTDYQRACETLAANIYERLEI